MKVILLLTIMVCISWAEDAGVLNDFNADKCQWSYWLAKEANAEFLHAPTDGMDSSGALELKFGNGNSKGACFLKHFPVEPGKRYTSTVWVKGSGLSKNTQLSLSFQGLDAKKNFLNNGIFSTFKPASEEWQRLILTFLVPDTGKWKEVKYLICTLGTKPPSAAGSAFFDDFFFTIDEDEE